MESPEQSDTQVIQLLNTDPTPADIPKEKDYDPERRRDSVRTSVTLSLTGLFIAMVSFACVAAWFGKERWEMAKEALQILLPAVSSLLGSALGFYFASQNKG